VSPDIIQPKELSLITTVEEAIDLTVPPPISWWVYLIAIIVGILFLILLIFLLAKVRTRQGGWGGDGSKSPAYPVQSPLAAVMFRTWLSRCLG